MKFSLEKYIVSLKKTQMLKLYTLIWIKHLNDPNVELKTLRFIYFLHNQSDNINQKLNHITVTHYTVNVMKNCLLYNRMNFFVSKQQVKYCLISFMKRKTKKRSNVSSRHKCIIIHSHNFLSNFFYLSKRDQNDFFSD